jgi:mycothiol S-conjugate amidase
VDVNEGPATEELRLLAVHAHPDDEASKGAATMASYAAQGARVMVATCTGGERGDIQNPSLIGDPHATRDMGGARRLEMANAAAILGIEHQWLGFTDSGLPEGDPLPPLPEGCFALLPVTEAAEPLVRAVRAFRPHVMLTYDQRGGYPHPDHIQCHRVSVEAFDAAADPDRYPDAGEPWQPLKLYYFASFRRARYLALHTELLRRGLDSPYTDWFKEHADGKDDRPELEVTTRIASADYFSIRDQALMAHATQIDPNSAWFACPLEVQQAAWPTEDYHLARSLVDTELPEDDLFAGVREKVCL